MFITGKRAYVFDGVKITRMSKNPDGSFGFEKSDVFPLSSSVTVSTELMEERYWEKFYPREMSSDSMIGLIYGFWGGSFVMDDKNIFSEGTDLSFPGSVKVRKDGNDSLGDGFVVYHFDGEFFV